MKGLYKISEFAALCATGRDTLLHYDKIGLLKPAYKAENGYRYYAPAQFYDFEVISILKECGAPLREIMAYLQEQDAQRGIALLEEKLQILRTEQKRIQLMQQSLRQSIASLREAAQCTCKQMELVVFEQQYLLVTPTHYQEPPDEVTFLQVIRRHFDYCGRQGLGERLQTGEIILREDAQQGRLVESFYFNPVEQPKPGARVRCRPAGLYAVEYHRGGYASLTKAYSTFLQKIEEKGYALAGDLYEDDLVDRFASADPGRYVMRLSAPVRRKAAADS